MRILHTADLHLGKRVNEYAMLEDQRFILNQILALVDRYTPDAVILAGDIYDKAQSANEAVELFDTFLTDLARRSVQVFILYGNHDSPERIACMSEIVKIAGVHLSPVYSGAVAPVSLTDQEGPVYFYMLPFVKPALVRRAFPDETIDSYTDALRAAVSHLNADLTQRNVLITHQFVTGASRAGSEEITVGGTDNVDASVFDGFDYVALGHIHGAQNVGGTPRIRYAGSPLKYSLSEAAQTKSVSLVDLGCKGELTVTELPLKPQYDLTAWKGRFAQLIDPEFYHDQLMTEDYVYITLTDEETIPDARRKLDRIYHRIMKVDYDNTRTRETAAAEELEAVEEIDPLEIFETLYRVQNGREMSACQRSLVQELLEKIQGGGTV